ncbi:hypothetical protein KW787_01230, partial [Candidatus Pacearchaeota archaeon]|nr:hypothetical protein [Candidatus Pacearchaeota archaeon]
YIIFAFLVIGFKGNQTPKLATIALGKPFILLGIITMFNAYLALSIALTQTFHKDLKKRKVSSWIYTISVPIILLVLLEIFNQADFIKILGIGGVVSGALAAILILLMVSEAKKHGNRKPEYSMPYSKISAYIMIIVFICASAAEIIITLRA